VLPPRLGERRAARGPPVVLAPGRPGNALVTAQRTRVGREAHCKARGGPATDARPTRSVNAARLPSTVSLVVRARQWSNNFETCFRGSKSVKERKHISLDTATQELVDWQVSLPLKHGCPQLL